MGAAVLVTGAIQEGSRLLKALDEAGIDVRSAMWLYDPDADRWRLVLAMPLVDERGPAAAFAHIQRALNQIGPSDVRLQEISVVSPKDQTIRAVRGLINTGPGPAVSQVRLVQNAVGSVLIEDALVYRST
jgi:hypothetical protein